MGVISINYVFYALLRLVCGFLNILGSFKAIWMLLKQSWMNQKILAMKVDEWRFLIDEYMLADFLDPYNLIE